MLLERKDVDVNAKDDDGITALGWAILRGHTNIVELLRSVPGVGGDMGGLS